MRKNKIQVIMDEKTAIKIWSYLELKKKTKNIFIKCGLHYFPRCVQKRRSISKKNQPNPRVPYEFAIFSHKPLSIPLYFVYK